MKNVARAPADASVSRILSAFAGGHHGRSGCSASKVRATPSLTGGHLRRVHVAPRRTPGGDRQAPGEELDRDDRRGRAQEAIERTDVDRRDAVGDGAAGGDEKDRGPQTHQVLYERAV